MGCELQGAKLAVGLRDWQLGCRWPRWVDLFCAPSYISLSPWANYLTYCHLVEGSWLGTQVSMAGYHLLAAPLAPTRTMLHSRNIDWGCYPQPGAGGRRHSDTTVPEGQRPTQGVH